MRELAVPARAARGGPGRGDVALRARHRRARPAQDEPGGALRHAAPGRGRRRDLPLRRLPGPATGFEQRHVVGGDATSAAIAAASVIAKVTRDRFMQRMEERYPGWEFAAHVGYSTPSTAPRSRSSASRRCTACRFSRWPTSSSRCSAAFARSRDAPELASARAARPSAAVPTPPGHCARGDLRSRPRRLARRLVLARCGGRAARRRSRRPRAHALRCRRARASRSPRRSLHARRRARRAALVRGCPRRRPGRPQLRRPRDRRRRGPGRQRLSRLVFLDAFVADRASRCSTCCGPSGARSMRRRRATA